jgi:glycosyltransferase involved in cell wall biosynthesis
MYSKFSRRTVDRILRTLPDAKNIMHIGTGDGLDLAYLSIAAKLRGGHVVSFDFKYDVHPELITFFGSLPSTTVYTLEATKQQRIATSLLYKSSDILIMPCNPTAAKRIFGVQQTFFYQFVQENKTVALCPEMKVLDEHVLEMLGFSEFKAIGSRKSGVMDAHLFRRVRLTGANVLDGRPIGEFFSPFNGEVKAEAEETSTVTLSASMSTDIFGALKDILFVKFTFDGEINIFDTFDTEEQARAEKRFTVRGVRYGTHSGALQLLFGTRERSIPIGKPINIVFDRVPLRIERGLSTDFKGPKEVHADADGSGTLALNQIDGREGELDDIVQYFQSPAPIRLIFMEGWKNLNDQQQVYLEQCKQLPKGTFKVVYMSLCHDDQITDSGQLKMLLEKYCGHVVSTPLTIPSSLASSEPPFLEMLGRAREISHLPEEWLSILQPVFDILKDQDIMITGNTGESTHHYIPELARISGIPLRLMELTQIAPPKRPLGLHGYVSPSEYVCRHPEFRKRNTHLPCHVIHPGIDTTARFGRGKTEMRAPSDDELVLGFIGEIDSSASPGLFIHACNEVAIYFQAYRPGKNGGPPLAVKCIFLGNGTLVKYLEEIAGQQRFAIKTIEFWPYDYYTFPQQLDKIDVAVFPKTGSETFGLSLLEAMASFVPTVQFGIGGTAAFSKDNETSAFVTGAQKLSTRVIDVVERSGFARSMTEKAEKLVKSAFNSERMGKDYASLYLKQFVRKAPQSRVREFCGNKSACLEWILSQQGSIDSN